MIPVFQTRTVANDGSGNCFNACVASILERPLSQVCQTLPGDGDAQTYWSRWFKWFKSEGLKLNWHPASQRPPRGFSIASGKSTRTRPIGDPRAGERISHACVAFDGVVVHDPFPLPGGFDLISGYWTIDPIVEAKAVA